MSTRLRAVARLRVTKGRADERPVLNLEDVEGGSARTVHDLRTAPAEDLLCFEPGDVLFSKLRPYLAKSLFVDRPLCGTSEFLCMIPSPALNAKFLLYSTMSKPWIEWSVQTSYGTKMPRTSWESISEQHINLPTITDQQRIANFLDDQTALLDRVLELRGRQMKLDAEALDTEARSLLIPGNSPLRTGIPLRRYVGRVQTGGTPSASEQWAWSDEGFPWYGPSSFDGDLTLGQATRRVSLRAMREGVLPLFPAGSVLMIGVGATSGPYRILGPAIVKADCYQHSTGQRLVCRFTAVSGHHVALSSPPAYLLPHKHFRNGSVHDSENPQ